MNHIVLQTLGIVFFLGMVSQWIAWKFRIPVIILLTLLGLLFGPILGLLQPVQVFGDILPSLIELAVAIILFEGGMNLRVHEFEQVSSGLKRLFSVAVLLNWIGGTLVAHFLGGLSVEVSLVISGILVVTGPTVIIPALREAKLKRSTANYLKWEGIINDPIGAMIAVLVFDFMVYRGQIPGTALVLMSLGKIILVSFGLSYITRSIVIFGTKKALLPEFLKIPFFITLILVLFIASDLIQKGSGLLTVTLLGLFIGNSNLPSVHDLRRFEESLAVFSVSAIFIILSASLDLSVWKNLSLQHFAMIVLFSFVVRPMAIFFSTIGSGMNMRERLLIGLYGPRGIVAVSVAGVIGNGLIKNGFAEGDYVLPVIFSVVILTVVFHSLWLGPLSKSLGLTTPGEHGILLVGASPWSIQLADKIKSKGIPVLMSDISWYKLAAARTSGVSIHYGNIIKDLEFGEPDLTAFNYLLALTEDDHYNSLVCHKLEHLFGSDHVYQLPVHADEFERNHGLRNPNFYSIADSQEALFENMMRNYHHGWVFKETVLTDKYPYEQFKKDNPPEASIYFLIIRGNKRVQIYGDDPLVKKPQVGDTIIYYSDKKRVAMESK